MTPAEVAAVTAKTNRIHELASSYAARIAADHETGKVNGRRFQDCFRAFIAGYSAASEPGSRASEIVTKGGAS